MTGHSDGEMYAWVPNTVAMRKVSKQDEQIR